MTSTLDALYAQVQPAPMPVVSLTEIDRRREGDDFPTVPVAGLELTPNEVAAALFETGADNLALPVPSNDALYAALTAAVNTLGPAGIAEVTDTFESLDADPVEWPEVAACRRFAYRLALSFWYEGARSRPMTAGEVGVAVYLSSLDRYRMDDFRQLPLRKMLLGRAIHEGVTAVPTETLIRLGAVMSGELGGTDRDRDREWLYKQALPNYLRRLFAFNLVQWNREQPAPLIVRLDGGGYLVGLTPPAGPDGMWQRPVRAEW
ncbi:hypothetical protein [Streptomyces sp. NBC_00989]|uniref:hypothetical protein n=1 Tax=Streptomyces sp. NBC_00989 TaxID=2903705 RepID=UPI00386C364B|nr:hypothetical protein OG714_27860 [Streptomyces sp. NBC_00989]